MKEQIYIYSGIEPGKKGAGNFVSFFINKLDQKKIDFGLIYYGTPDGLLVKIVKKLGLLKILKNVYYKVVQNVSKTQIKNAKVILFHPQSIGLKTVTDLIKDNKVYFYVLDNFLFCKKSYNFIQGYNSCIECIKDKNAHIENGCDFFPNNHTHDEYDILIETIEKNLGKIIFLTQNENQSILLDKKFGMERRTHQVGMLIDLDESKKLSTNDVKQYDFLYHNTLSEAKGLKYFLELVAIMEEFSFAIPYTRQQVKNVIPSLKKYKNLDFLSVTWDTGLREILENCKMVLNPSLWSAPVEGALLKSIYYNGCVGIMPTNYSFQKEIPLDVVVHLEGNIIDTVKVLSNIVKSDELKSRYKINSKQWIQTYVETTNANFDIFIKEEFL